MGFWLLMAQASYAQASWSFSGEIDFSQKKIDVVFFLRGERLLSLQLKSVSENNYQLDAKVDHLQAPLFDISTVLTSSVEIVSGETQPLVRGSLESKYTLFNYKPAPELVGHFVIKKGRLYFYSLSWGGMMCDGYIGLFAPHEISLAIKFIDTPMVDAMDLLGCRNDLAQVSGDLSGEINLSGFLDQLYLKGRLSANNGMMQNLEYDNMLINFEGAYPIVKLENSMIAQADGLSFNIDGSFNLAAKCDLAGGLSALKISPLTTEASGHREWTIKRKQTEGTDSATEFKYRLRKEGKGNVSINDDADLLGVERSIKF